MRCCCPRECGLDEYTCVASRITRETRLGPPASVLSGAATFRDTGWEMTDRVNPRGPAVGTNQKPSPWGETDLRWAGYGLSRVRRTPSERAYLYDWETRPKRPSDFCFLSSLAMMLLSRWLALPLVLLLLSGSMAAWGQSSSQRLSQERVERRYALVDSLRTEREFRAALARLDELARTHSRTVGVLWRQSILWSDLGKEFERGSRSEGAYRRALSIAEEALEVDRRNAWAHVAKALSAGRIATLSNSNKESIQRSRAVKEHIDRALEIDSSLAAAYHVRGRWHREVADLNFVQRMIVKAVYGGLPTASVEQAVEDFQRAIELETRSYHHLELGKTYRKMGRTEAARAQLKTAVDAPWRDPFDPEYKQEARRLLVELD